ncbi:MAG: hypothetical protein MZV64_50455 [Ignavibacteriales bacterium]|nr:hypothetical protein [Ignavibacteriales bacterium]
MLKAEWDLSPERIELKGSVSFHSVLRGHISDSVEHKKRLDIVRGLAPECSVIVEGGNSLIWRNIIRMALVGGISNKADDMAFVDPSFQEGRGSAVFSSK